VRIRKPLAFLTLAAVLLTLPAGCYSLSEIEDQAFVTAIGVDRVGTDKVRLSIQVANPSAIPTGGGLGGGASGTQGGQAVWVVGAEGRTLSGAAERLQRVSSRVFEWSHASVLVVSEDAARDPGMDVLLDFFLRFPAPRLTTRLMISKDRAEEVLKGTSVFDPIPATAWKSVAERTLGLTQNIVSFVRIMQEPTSSAYTVYVQLAEDRSGVDLAKQRKARELQPLAAAVFKRGTLDVVLDAAATRGLLWAAARGRVIDRVDVEVPGRGTAGLWVKRVRSEVRPLLFGSTPVAEVTTQVWGEVHDAGALDLELLYPDSLRIVENALERLVRREVAALLSVTKERGLDVLRIRAVFDAKYPSFFELHPVERWPSLYRDMQIRYNVRVNLVRAGLYRGHLLRRTGP